ncbi:MAG: cell wall hydrolase, partial [Hungatella sp.]
MKHSWKNPRGSRIVITAVAIAAAFTLTAFSSPGHLTPSLPETAKEGIITDGGSVNVKAADAAPQVGIERKEVPVTHA